MRPATVDEIKNWDRLVAANPDGGNVLQSKAFAETKADFGWLPAYYIHDQVAVLYLIKSLTVIGELWYCPKGPCVATVDQLKTILEQFRSAQTPAFALKIEPELALGSNLDGLDLLKTRDVQLNSSTLIVDLKPSEEEIMALFKQKARYNLRLAERKGVQVEPVQLTEANMNSMYQMMQQTYSRAGIYTRPYDYFKKFWQRHTEDQVGQLFLATFEGETVAGAFVTFLGKKALYKDGGSIRDSRNLQAPHLLQWRIMQWLKTHGIEAYDLHGVPPPEQLDDPKHQLASLVQFKTGFESEITQYIGTYDFVLDQAKYAKWLKRQRWYDAYERRVKKRLFY